MALHPVFVHFHTGILTATAALAIFSLILRLPELEWQRSSMNLISSSTGEVS
jgi:hypothetical protein